MAQARSGKEVKKTAEGFRPKCAPNGRLPCRIASLGEQLSERGGEGTSRTPRRHRSHGDVSGLRAFVASRSSLEVDLRAELGEARLLNARRRQPVSVRNEALVVAQDRRLVHYVIDVEPDVR